jgi:hypothetical protein
MQQYKKNFWGNWVSNSTTYAGQNVNYTYHYNTYFRVPMDPDYIEKTVSQRSISFGSGGTVSSYNYVLIPEYYAIRQGGFSGSLYSGGLGNYHPFTHDFPW